MRKPLLCLAVLVAGCSPRLSSSGSEDGAESSATGDGDGDAGDGDGDTGDGDGDTGDGDGDTGDGDGDTGDGDGDTGDGDGDSGDGDGDDPGCNGDDQLCDAGQICDGEGACVPALALDECELGLETFVPLPVPPELAAIDALGIGIVDVDVDGDGELILLHPSTVSVWLDDDSLVHSNNFGLSAPDVVVGVFRSGVELPMLEVASTTVHDDAREMENLGGGAFADDGPTSYAGEHPLITRYVPADLDEDEILNDLLGMTSIGRMEVWTGSNFGVSYSDTASFSAPKVDFAAADWDQDGDFDFVAVPPELVGLAHWENIGGDVEGPVNWEDSPISGPEMAWQALATGELSGDQAGDLAAFEASNGRTALGIWQGAGDGSFFGESLSVVPQEHNLAAALTLAPGTKRELLLVNAAGSLLVFTAEDPSSMCWESTPISGVSIAIGDLDGDQRDEVAVLDELGKVSVWTRQ